MQNKVEPRKAIARRLKQAREQVGYLSAEEFCEKNKLSLNAYQACENASKAIKISQMENYCKLFNVSLRWLIIGEGES